MTDDELLQAFEDGSLPFEQWTHRCHVKVAYLYLRRLPFEPALAQIRDGIRRYNAAHSVPEGPDRGYHETMTHAFAHLIAAMLDAWEPVLPTDSAEAFCAAHPQLLSKYVLRLFYSPALRANPRAKAEFVEPDLAPLPKRQSKPVVTERDDPTTGKTAGKGADGTE